MRGSAWPRAQCCCRCRVRRRRTVVDAGGRSVRIADASRILSIGGDVTEIVYALGAGSRVVGVDTTSQFPPEALKEKKSVGYMRALSTEGVISVGATLILASERSGPPEVVKTLKTTSVPYVEVPDQHSAAGIAAQGAPDRQGGRRRGRGRDAVRSRWRPTSPRWPSARAQDQAPRAGAVRAGRAERPRDGRRPGHQRRCHPEARRRRRTSPAAVTGFRPLPDEAIVELAPEVIVAMRRSSGNDAHDLAQLFALKGIAVDAGRRRQAHRHDGRAVSAGLRPARARCRARPDGPALSRSCRPSAAGATQMTAVLPIGTGARREAARMASAGQLMLHRWPLACSRWPPSCRCRSARPASRLPSLPRVLGAMVTGHTDAGRRARAARAARHPPAAPAARRLRRRGAGGGGRHDAGHVPQSAGRSRA